MWNCIQALDLLSFHVQVMTATSSVTVLDGTIDSSAAATPLHEVSPLDLEPLWQHPHYEQRALGGSTLIVSGPPSVAAPTL